MFQKPYKKQNKIGTKDKMLEEIRKGREERLAALKEMRQGELSNDPIQIFFKSMASTVATFPPELAVEAKTKVFNIISEMELRSLKAKTSYYTSSVETMALASHKPSKVVPTVFIEGDSSSSATTISSISENSISSPAAGENSSYAYLQYYNNDYQFICYNYCTKVLFLYIFFYFTNKFKKSYVIKNVSIQFFFLFFKVKFIVCFNIKNNLQYLIY